MICFRSIDSGYISIAALTFESGRDNAADLSKLRLGMLW